jgi:hypothetical protein
MKKSIGTEDSPIPPNKQKIIQETKVKTATEYIIILTFNSMLFFFLSGIHIECGPKAASEDKNCVLWHFSTEIGISVLPMDEYSIAVIAMKNIIIVKKKQRQCLIFSHAVHSS